MPSLLRLGKNLFAFSTVLLVWTDTSIIFKRMPPTQTFGGSFQNSGTGRRAAFV